MVGGEVVVYGGDGEWLQWLCMVVVVVDGSNFDRLRQWWYNDCDRGWWWQWWSWWQVETMVVYDCYGFEWRQCWCMVVVVLVARIMVVVVLRSGSGGIL